MKKKLLLAGATLLLAAAAVTGFAAYEKSNVSDLLNANVEALARNEIEGDMHCEGWFGVCVFNCDCGFSFAAVGDHLVGSHKCSR